jgi:hypothetical protein
LDENYILFFNITDYKIFGKNRDGIIRYVGNNKYQHIVETVYSGKVCAQE